MTSHNPPMLFATGDCTATGSKPARSRVTREMIGNRKAPTPERLQQQISADRPHNPHPVACRASTCQYRGAVEGGIERRIRSKREKKEERGDTQQEAHELIEPAVVGRVKDLRKELHEGVVCANGRGTETPVSTRVRQSPLIMPRSRGASNRASSKGVTSWLPANGKRTETE